MASGLQVWDGNGNNILDTNVRTGRIAGYQDTGGGNGSIAIPGLGGTGTFFYTVVMIGSAPAHKIPLDCTVSWDGWTMSWSYMGAFSEYVNVNCRIFYGVY